MRVPTWLSQLTGAGRLALWAAGFLLAWLVGAVLLPKGLPAGVVVLGLLLGALSAMTAMGLVLIYRSARVINFAQAEIGGLAAAVAVVMVAGWHLPFFLAVIIGLAVAVGSGALVDFAVVKRLFSAPRLVLTVATIGVAQILGAAELGLPSLFPHLSAFSNFTTPFNVSFSIGTFVFNGNDMLAMVVVPVVLVSLAWFFGRTDTGIAVRAAADSAERASLLGIPVRRLSMVTWMVAAGLSGLGALLSAPILGPSLGAIAGPEALLAPLAAAVVAGMESLPVAFGTSLAIGVFEQAVYWSYPRSTTVDVALFVLVLAAVLVRKRSSARVSDQGLGGFKALQEVRPVASQVANLVQYRWAKVSAVVVLVVAALLVPVALSNSIQVVLGYMAIYGILAVSLVILTGWAGQMSLGQFAFAGVGAAATGSLLVEVHADLFLALAAAIILSALVAVVIGIPALRIPGPFLAVVTLAFAVPVSSYFLNSAYFPALTPALSSRPVLFGRIPLEQPLAFYQFCLVMLIGSYIFARNFRRGRAGRAVLAVRENERGAASFGVNPARAKLTAFAFSGGLAGLAGGLYVVGLRGIGFSGFNPEKSLVVFTMVVVGGLGSLPGALAGAAYVEYAEYFLHGAGQLLATGAGLLILLLILPGGLGSLLYKARDRFVSALVSARGLSSVQPLEAAAAPGLSDTGVLGDTGVLKITPAPHGTDQDTLITSEDNRPQLASSRDADLATSPAGRDGSDTTGPGARIPGGFTSGTNQVLDEGSILWCKDIDASYGPVQVLFGVDLSVTKEEIVGLLGTNGAGKSTLLKVFSGLLESSRGKVFFDGSDITDLDPAERVRRGLVMVPGGRGVFPSLTVAENLRLAGWLWRKHRRDHEGEMRHILELFPVLGSRMSERAELLSGGEQQMLTLAQALLCQPKALLVDELSLGLAPTVVAQLIVVLEALAAQGVAVVVVEQSLNVAISLAKRSAFMERGKVCFSGPTAELEDHPELVRSVFLGGAGDHRQPISNVESKDGGPMTLEAGALAGVGRMAHLSAEDKGPGSSVRGSASKEPASARELVLATRAVSKRYGGVVALLDVDLSVFAGEIVGIIGANGAGKTTLLDVCSGFVDPDGGVVAFLGEEITHLGPSQRAEAGMGRLFQDARLFPALTARETIAVALERHVAVREPVASSFRVGDAVSSEAAVYARVDELLEMMGLARYADSFLSELSTGTRRVLELACAVGHDPAVLLLDEPSSGIAQRETEALAGVLRQLRDATGMTLVVIDHDVPLVSAISDHLVCMHLGQVIKEGQPEEVLADPAVVAAYLGTDERAIHRSGAGRAAETPSIATRL